MNKETVFSLVRAVLTSLGVFLLGKNLLGNKIDQSVIEMLSGSAMALVSLVWSVLSKEAGIEIIQTTLRQVLVGVGGLLVASGKVTGEKLEAVLGLLTALVPFLYSILSRKKTANIVSGKLDTSKLSQ